MNYKKIYDNLVAKRKLCIPKGYTEAHHVLPRSLGGSDTADNIVKLTAREHFIAHLLLTKVFAEGTKPWIKMQKALMIMFNESCFQQRYTPSKWYAVCREKIAYANSISQSGEGNSQHGKIWIYNAELEQSISVYVDELSHYLSNGWCKGRVINWDKFRLKNEFRNKITLQRNKRFEDNVSLYTRYYNIYNKYGWGKFVELVGYTKSKPALIYQFARYVKNYKPQNGRKRGL